MAITLALRSPAFNVLGITCVGGNTVLENVIRNTLVVVEHSGKKVPVYAGLSRPLFMPLQTAKHAHGSDGLGDIGFPIPQGQPEQEHAVDYLVRAFMESKEPVDLITLAPLTNVALALMREPRLEEHIHSLVMMAGGLASGNANAVAEFNVWVDPEAADVVFRSRISKTMIALDPIIEYSKITAEQVAPIEACQTPWCWLVGRLLRRGLERWQGPVSPPDLTAMAVALDPSIAQAQMYYVAVETKGEHTRGMTVADRRRWRSDLVSRQANVNVVERIDTQRYRELVIRTFVNDGRHP
jgi:inosine-uridine nucleoside N-ribohydrolase